MWNTKVVKKCNSIANLGILDLKKWPKDCKKVKRKVKIKILKFNFLKFELFDNQNSKHVICFVAVLFIDNMV